MSDILEDAADHLDDWAQNLWEAPLWLKPHFAALAEHLREIAKRHDEVPSVVYVHICSCGWKEGRCPDRVSAEKVAKKALGHE